MAAGPVTVAQRPLRVEPELARHPLPLVAGRTMINRDASKRGSFFTDQTGGRHPPQRTNLAWNVPIWVGPFKFDGLKPVFPRRPQVGHGGCQSTTTS